MPPAPFHILVVDDETSIRTLVRKVLTHSGHRVLEAGDGAEALELCSNPAQPVDLVVTDIAMPRVNGWELERRMQTTRPGTKVLFMSGDPAALAEAARKSISVIPKPFQITALAQAVARALA
jgi:CheY-like chemotaxis protein